ncbi:MAG: hypothetical protein ACRD2A_00435, partial [Vicinamibacterales bacterium]
VTTGDDPERTDRRERARLGAAQHVHPIAVADNYPLPAAREIEIAHEHLTRVEVALASITVTLRRARVIMANAGVLISVGTARIIAWTSAKLARIVI